MKAIKSRPTCLPTFSWKAACEQKEQTAVSKVSAPQERNSTTNSSDPWLHLQANVSAVGWAEPEWTLLGLTF